MKIIRNVGKSSLFHYLDVWITWYLYTEILSFTMTRNIPGWHAYRNLGSSWHTIVITESLASLSTGQLEQQPKGTNFFLHGCHGQVGKLNSLAFWRKSDIVFSEPTVLRMERSTPQQQKKRRCHVSQNFFILNQARIVPELLGHFGVPFPPTNW